MRFLRAFLLLAGACLAALPSAFGDTYGLDLTFNDGQETYIRFDCRDEILAVLQDAMGQGLRAARLTVEPVGPDLEITQADVNGWVSVTGGCLRIHPITSSDALRRMVYVLEGRARQEAGLPLEGLHKRAQGRRGRRGDEGDERGDKLRRIGLPAQAAEAQPCFPQALAPQPPALAAPLVLVHSPSVMLMLAAPPVTLMLPAPPVRPMLPAPPVRPLLAAPPARRLLRTPPRRLNPAPTSPTAPPNSSLESLYATPDLTALLEGGPDLDAAMAWVVEQCRTRPQRLPWLLEMLVGIDPDVQPLPGGGCR
jgi:hypothetical protein